MEERERDEEGKREREEKAKMAKQRKAELKKKRRKVEEEEEEKKVAAEKEEEEEDDSESDDELMQKIQQKAKPKQMFVDDRSDDDSDSEESDDPTLGFKNKDIDASSDEDEEDSDAQVAGDEGEDEEEEEEEDDISRVMEVFQLPETEEEGVDPATIQKRIKEVLGVLNNFRKLAKEGQSRSDFVEQLTKDCARFYGYLPTLIEMFLRIFSPEEMVEFLEANETPRPVVIRTNTLKARMRELAKALTTRGVSLEPLGKWSNVGLKIFESTVPIGATPEYLTGQYILQSASSFTPVLALDPQVNEKILDMASAPGGKTSYIAQLMKNTGLVVANDRNKDRMNATIANCARLGVRNTIHCNYDGREFPKVMGGFDRVLLDAPCSGLGVIQRDPSVKLSRTVEDIRQTVFVQKQLLLAAIDSVNFKSRTGGIIVYATCSIAPEENEMVVQYALEKRDVQIVDSGLEFGRPGLTRYLDKRFHPRMKMARRLYPHVHNMDGFFFVKLKKLSNNHRSLANDEVEHASMELDEGSTNKKGPAKGTKGAKRKEPEETPTNKPDQRSAKKMKKTDDVELAKAAAEALSKSDTEATIVEDKKTPKTKKMKNQEEVTKKETPKTKKMKNQEEVTKKETPKTKKMKNQEEVTKKETPKTKKVKNQEEVTKKETPKTKKVKESEAKDTGKDADATPAAKAKGKLEASKKKATTTVKKGTRKGKKGASTP